MVVEFIVNWQPRCSTGKGCVHVSSLPMHIAYPADTSGLFYYIRSLGTN